MPLIVQKYGGSSVADAAGIKRVAKRIVNAKRAVAMAVSALGAESRSYAGSQAGLVTSSAHRKARAVSVRPSRIQAALDEGAIAIVAGFQGVSEEEKDITTLGRGACLWRPTWGRCCVQNWLLLRCPMSAAIIRRHHRKHSPTGYFASL